MSVVYKFLFPAKPVGNAFSLFLLALRILFGVLLLSHGIQTVSYTHLTLPTN